ncbi:MAG: hypothetical protein DRP30_00515 [Thermotoga sp.]|nr:MAG: hypothetical protein DRP30_00515 [Thermotoga sp.]
MPRKRYVELSEKEARFVGLSLIILFTICIVLLIYSLILRARIEQCRYRNQQLEEKLERLNRRFNVLVSTGTSVQLQLSDNFTDVVATQSSQSSMAMCSECSLSSSQSSTISTQVEGKTEVGTSASSNVKLFEIEKFDYEKYFKKSTDFYIEGEPFMVVKAGTDTTFKLIVDTGLPYFLMRDSTDSTIMKLVIIGRNGENPKERIPESVSTESLNIFENWYSVQILAHRSERAVRGYVKELRESSIPAIDYVFKTSRGSTLHGLIIGIFTSVEEAREFSKSLDEDFLIKKYGSGVKRRYVRKIK